MKISPSLFEIEDYPTAPSDKMMDKWADFGKKYREKLGQYRERHGESGKDFENTDSPPSR